MANYLQRVIASGARTTIAERPPASVAPLVPIASTQPQPSTPELEDSAQLDFNSPSLPSTPPFTPGTASVNRLEPPKSLASELPAPFSLLPNLTETRPAPERPVDPEKPIETSAPATPPALPMEATRIQAPKALRRAASPPPAAGPALPHAAASQLAATNSAAVESAVAPPQQPPAATVELPAAPAAAPPPPAAHSLTPATRIRQNSNDPQPSAVPPPSALPAREGPSLPGAAAASRPPGRISIGRIDVQVHNRPAVPARVLRPSRASATAQQSGPSEALGLDRFAMKP